MLYETARMCQSATITHEAFAPSGFLPVDPTPVEAPPVPVELERRKVMVQVGGCVRPRASARLEPGVVYGLPALRCDDCGGDTSTECCPERAARIARFLAAEDTDPDHEGRG